MDNATQAALAARTRTHPHPYETMALTQLTEALTAALAALNYRVADSSPLDDPSVRILGAVHTRADVPITITLNVTP